MAKWNGKRPVKYIFTAIPVTQEKIALKFEN
jgi:hypothetical protein